MQIIPVLPTPPARSATPLDPLPPHSQATESPERITLDVSGMKCAGCVKAVENQLQQVPGVETVWVNLVTEVAVVACEPGRVSPLALAQKLTSAGFPSQARVGDETTPPVDLAAQRRRAAQAQRGRLAIALLLLLLSSLGHWHQFGGQALAELTAGLTNIWLHAGLATVALLGPGRQMAIDGWRGLRQNAPNMDTLVSLGTWTAYTTSLMALLFPQLGWECFFDEPVMLVGFILLGRTLEQQARNRAATAFHSLLALQPKVARLIAPATSPSAAPTHIEIPVAHVRVGDVLQVLPGDKVPVDGEVVSGQTTVDEAMLTGEGLPVLKHPGDWVSAGTLNCSGAIALRVTRTGHATTLAQIIALVESAQTRKAPIQSLADTVAGYFTYGVMAIASVTFCFWYFIGTALWPHALASHALAAAQTGMGMGGMAGHAMAHQVLSTPTPHLSPLLISLKLAIAVLVVACPCALGLATPTAMLVGSGIGAERGLLIRGGDVLERMHRVDTIVFDKTGTLTTATPQVADCISLSAAILPETVRQLAATVESGTQHPLAAAILHGLDPLTLLPAADWQTIPGVGISAQVELDGSMQHVWVGNLVGLGQRGLPWARRRSTGPTMGLPGFMSPSPNGW